MFLASKCGKLRALSARSIFRSKFQLLVQRQLNVAYVSILSSSVPVEAADTQGCLLDERKSALFDRACCLSQTIHHVFMESFAAFCIWIYEILCKFSTVMLWSKQGWIRVPLCCSYLRKLCSVNWYAIWWEIFSPHAIDRMWFGTGLRAVCLSQYIHFS